MVEKGSEGAAMSKQYDLMGQQFGKLTVTGRDTEATGKPWICVCSCGNKKLASSNHLMNGDVSSCGCLRSEIKIKDLTGQRFGNLVAVRRTGKQKYRSQVWECRCDCGNVSEVTAGNLRSGTTRSCGCAGDESRIESMKKAVEKRQHYYIEGTDIFQLCQSPARNNTSGVVGVSYHKTQRLWKANIQFKGRLYYLGASADKDVAIAFRKEAEQRLHGEFLDWYYAREIPVIAEFSKKQAHAVLEGYSFEVGV